MRKYKGFMILLLILGFFAVRVEAQETKKSFSDLSGKEWFVKYLYPLAENKNEIIKGFPDGSFRGSHTLSVDQFVTMLVRAAGEKVEKAEGYWAAPYLERAKEMKILIAGEFEHGDKEHRAKREFSDSGRGITREEMSVMIQRYLVGREEISLDTSGIAEGILDFVMVGAGSAADKDREEKRESVKRSYGMGILTGYEDGSFRPEQTLTRAEATAVVMRILDSSLRAPYDKEKQMAQKEKELQQYYYGGKKWINPADDKISKMERVKIDRMLTTSDMEYVPNIVSVRRNGYPKLSMDDVRGVIRYDKNGAKPGQVEDFERLLKRRLPEQDVKKVMDYLKQKKSHSDHLDYPGTDFFLDSGRYMVRLEETIDFKNNSYTIGFNIWFMDQKWTELYKEIYDYGYHKIN